MKYNVNGRDSAFSLRERFFDRDIAIKQKVTDF